MTDNSLDTRSPTFTLRYPLTLLPSDGRTERTALSQIIKSVLRWDRGGKIRLMNLSLQFDGAMVLWKCILIMEFGGENYNLRLCHNKGYFKEFKEFSPVICTPSRNSDVFDK